MRFVIDRFEGDFAVIESEGSQLVNIPYSLIPNGAKEGDSLIFENGVYVIDSEITSQSYDRIKSKFDKLRKNKK